MAVERARLGIVKCFRLESAPSKGRSERAVECGTSGDARRIVLDAVFFDLDRTLIPGSSALALAGEFRKRGLLSGPELAQAAAWQLIFTKYGPLWGSDV
jgi:hypothetical protein